MFVGLALQESIQLSGKNAISEYTYHKVFIFMPVGIQHERRDVKRRSIIDKFIDPVFPSTSLRLNINFRDLSDELSKVQDPVREGIDIRGNNRITCDS